MSWNFESADGKTCYLQKDAGDVQDKQGAVAGQCSSPQPLHFVGQNSPILLGIVCTLMPRRRC